MADLPSRDLLYTVPNLNEGEEASFRIIAVNGIGPSEPSRPTDAITIQDQPGISIPMPCTFHSIVLLSIEKPSFLDLHGVKDITVKAGNDFEVHIPYKATPKPQVQWLIDDKELLDDDHINLKVRWKIIPIQSDVRLFRRRIMS